MWTCIKKISLLKSKHQLKQENHWRRKILPKWLLSIKGKTFNQTRLVHTGLWFLSSVLPYINIYVCTNFNFNPFSIFQDMTRISKHYEKRLMGDNSVIYRVWLRFLCTAFPLTAIYL